MNIRKAIIALGIAFAAVVANAPTVHAETRLVLNGALVTGPLTPIANDIPFVQTILDDWRASIGANWCPGTVAVAVHYPATAGWLWGFDAPSADESLAIGQANLHAAILTAVEDDAPVVVAGVSMGSMVIDRELAYLATDPTAPPPDQLSFVLFSGPERGVASLFGPGTYIPLLGLTTRPIPESQYDLDVAFAEYDAWADFPDRPWNLLAVANGMLGALFVHNQAAYDYESQAVVMSSVTNSLGGTVTTYMIPAQGLPLTEVFRTLGVPTALTDLIDAILRPIVDAGYSRNDVGPSWQPYISQGRLVVPQLEIVPTGDIPQVNVAAAAPARDDTSEVSLENSDRRTTKHRSAIQSDDVVSTPRSRHVVAKAPDAPAGDVGRDESVVTGPANRHLMPHSRGSSSRRASAAAGGIPSDSIHSISGGGSPSESRSSRAPDDTSIPGGRQSQQPPGGSTSDESAGQGAA